MAIVSKGSGGSIKFTGTGGGISITSSGGGGGGGGGGSIVTSDLVVHLDAGNTASYQYNGNYYSNWTDLSGQGNNALVFGAPTVDGNNGGSMVLDGSNHWATFTSYVGIPGGTSPGTISCWASAATISGGPMWVIGYGNNDTSLARMLGTQGTTYYFDGWNNAITAEGVTLDGWFNIVGVYDGTNASMYVNGTLVAGPTAKSWNTTVPYSYQIGRSSGGGGLWNGKIAKILMYNKALNGGEVLQNFNADKTRFGL